MLIKHGVGHDELLLWAQKRKVECSIMTCVIERHGFQRKYMIPNAVFFKKGKRENKMG